MTKTVTIGDDTFTIAPLTFEQFEQYCCDENGMTSRPKVPEVVSSGLTNGGVMPKTAAEVRQMPAMLVLRLHSEIMRCSGMLGEDKPAEAGL